MTPTEIYVLVLSPICAVALILTPLAFAVRDVVRGMRTDAAPPSPCADRRAETQADARGPEQRVVAYRYRPAPRRRKQA